MNRRSFLSGIGGLVGFLIPAKAVNPVKPSYRKWGEGTRCWMVQVPMEHVNQAGTELSFRDSNSPSAMQFLRDYGYEFPNEAWLEHTEKEITTRSWITIIEHSSFPNRVPGQVVPIIAPNRKKNDRYLTWLYR